MSLGKRLTLAAIVAGTTIVILTAMLLAVVPGPGAAWTWPDTSPAERRVGQVFRSGDLGWTVHGLHDTPTGPVLDVTVHNPGPVDRPFSTALVRLEDSLLRTVAPDPMATLGINEAAQPGGEIVDGAAVRIRLVFVLPPGQARLALIGAGEKYDVVRLRCRTGIDTEKSTGENDDQA